MKHAQILLGHARLDTTANTYVHVDEEKAREAAEAVSDALLTSCPLFAHLEGSKGGQNPVIQGAQKERRGMALKSANPLIWQAIR